MRPTALSLLAGALATSALMAAGGLTPAHAAETCYGLAPTITAKLGAESVRGTEGDDVIIARDVQSVYALGGNDTLCLTGAIFVLAGDGNDRVRSRTTEGRHVVVLGSGSDLFDGSHGRDRVYAEQFDGEDPYPGEGTENTDTVRTYGGPDTVHSGAEGQQNHDVVDLGAGNDDLSLGTVLSGNVQATGGPGSDGVGTSLRRETRSWSFDIDLAAGAATVDGVRFATIPDFERVYWYAYSSSVRVVGTDGPNVFSIDGRVSVEGAAGDDTMTLLGELVTVKGGRGRDAVEVTGYGDSENLPVVFDLGRQRVTRGAASAAFQTEKLHVWGTGGRRERVRVIGSKRRDFVTVGACGAVVRGVGGDDVLRSVAEQCGRVETKLDGGGGSDVLRGGDDRDVLIGGAGRDRAHGGEKRDRCRAEVERDCERN